MLTTHHFDHLRQCLASSLDVQECKACSTCKEILRRRAHLIAARVRHLSRKHGMVLHQRHVQATSAFMRDRQHRSSAVAIAAREVPCNSLADARLRESDVQRGVISTRADEREVRCDAAVLCQKLGQVRACGILRVWNFQSTRHAVDDVLRHLAIRCPLASGYCHDARLANIHDVVAARARAVLHTTVFVRGGHRERAKARPRTEHVLASHVNA
mmetsp:Transcript_12365/g.31018  ORF Transcript_12365/g.31018 Transcript_12365/m.31018 type:complete len:214 (+) Transcript_12365:188-829(+)